MRADVKEILFITGNKGKLKEAQLILEGINLFNEPFDLIEIQGTPEEVINYKLDTAFAEFKRPLFVEDTCLFFEALGGLPGPYIKDFEKNISFEKLVKIAKIDSDGKAKAAAYIGYIDAEGNKTILKGECLGKIVKPRGENGFGWDVIFVPKGYEKTFAEMTTEEKNLVSHRKKAFEAFKSFLSN